MSINYTDDILPLWTATVAGPGAKDIPEIVAIPADLKDQPSEQRILTTIEVLRAHLEELDNRTEANLLLEAIARLTARVGSGGFVYDPERITVLGNIGNPTFVPGAGCSITTAAGTTAITAPAGGNLDSVIAQLNSALSSAVAEITTFTAEADALGSLGGKYITMNGPVGAPADDFYAWFTHPGRAELESITVPDADTFTRSTTAGGPAQEGDYWYFDTVGGDYFVWYDVAPVPETTEVEVRAAGGYGSSIIPGAPGAAARWELEDAATGIGKFYVWYDPQNAEVSTITIPVAGDTGGDLSAKSFRINGALGSPTWLENQYYVWYDMAARAEVTNVTLKAGGSYPPEVAPGVPPTTPGEYWEVTDDSGSFYLWYSVEDPLVQDLAFPATGALTYAGVGTPAPYFILNVPFGHPAFPGFYVWIDLIYLGGNMDPGPPGAAIPALVGYTGLKIDITAPLAGPAFALEILSNTMGPAGPVQGLIPDPVAGGEFAGTSNFPPASPFLQVVNSTLGANALATDGVPPLHIWTGLTVPPALAGGFPVPAGPNTDPVGIGTGIKVPINANDLSTGVASKTRTALGAVNVALSGVNPTITMTQNVAGDVTDANNAGSALTGLPSITPTGLDASSDPGGTGTGVPVAYTADASGATLATLTAAELDGLGDFNAPPPGGLVVTVTNVNVGPVNDLFNIDMPGGWGFGVTSLGVGGNTDPAIGGSTGVLVALATGDSPTAVAAKTITQLIGAGFNSPVPSPTTPGKLVVTNPTAGAAPDITTAGGGLLSVTAHNNITLPDGSDANVIPTGGNTVGRTGIQVNVNITDLAGGAPPNTVANRTSLAINNVDAIGFQVGTTTEIRVQHGAAGAVPGASDDSAGVVVNIPTIIGVDPATTDPAPGPNNSVTVTIAVDDIPTAVAGKARVAIATQAGVHFTVGPAGPSALIQLTNTVGGDAPDATNGDTGWVADPPTITDGTAGTPSSIEAFRSGTRIGFRNSAGNEDTPFTLIDGIGGILVPAGVAAGEYTLKKIEVARQGRDRALAVYEGQNRDPVL